MNEARSRPTEPRTDAAVQTLLNALNGRPLVLVGMMGAGKTSVGRRLASLLGRAFLDSDFEIEAAAGMSIEDFFKIHGEKDFRIGETKVINRLLGQNDIVLATGGGAFINPQTRRIIARKAVSVWIRAEFELLFARISRKNNRPLLQTPDPRKTLKDLMQARYPLYARADVCVVSRDVPHDAVAREIIQGLNAHFAQQQPEQIAPQ